MKKYPLLLALLPALPAPARIAPAATGLSRQAAPAPPLVPERIARGRTKILAGQLELCLWQRWKVYPIELRRMQALLVLRQQPDSVQTAETPVMSSPLYLIEVRYRQQLSAVLPPKQMHEYRLITSGKLHPR